MNSFCRAANEYLGQRKGTYEFRCRRYAAVLEKMLAMGFAPQKRMNIDIVADLGAGRCEFGMFLRERYPQSKHLYLPFDAAIDGFNLEEGSPCFHLKGVTFYVAIESLEHLNNLSVNHFLSFMPYRAAKGAVLTTPDPETTDVLGMDATHKTPIGSTKLTTFGWHVEHQQLFTDRKDTIVAWKESP